MKVLHLFRQYLGISESWAFNLLDHLTGCENVIGAVYYNDETRHFPDKFTYIELEQNLEAYFKNPQKIRFYKRYSYRIKRIFFKEEYLKIKRWIRANQPSLIHCHFGTTAAHFLPILYSLDIPIIVSFYGYDYRSALVENPSLLSDYKLVFNVASAVTSEERSGIHKLTELKCPSEKIRVVRLGVDIDQIGYRPPKIGSVLKLIQIANFAEKKGQMDVVRMVLKYRKQLQGKIELVFLGDSDTDYGLAVKKRIEEEALEDIIKLQNQIKYDKIHKYLEGFNIFIHPSRYAKNGDSEGGAPTILLDAQAVGLPILSTNHCDIPSYVPKENHFLLCEEGDIDQLYENLMLLFEEEIKIDEICQNGRLHIERHFNIKNNAKKLEVLYKTLQ